MRRQVLFLMSALAVIALALPSEAGFRVRSRCSVRSICCQPATPAAPCPAVESQPTPIDQAPSLSLQTSTVTYHREVQTVRSTCNGTTCRLRSVSVTRSTAQSRADRLAQLDPGGGLQQGHHAAIGPISGTEGIGYGSTPEQATRNCCYWGQRTPREIGTAQGSRGWYAVVLYD